jgi:hypothetical protein
LNWTWHIGVWAYGAAAAACALAGWRHLQAGRSSPYWFLLAFAYVLLTVDIWFSLRFLIARVFQNQLQSFWAVSGAAGLQVGLTCLIMILLLSGVTLTAFRKSRKNTECRVATLGVLLGGGLWAVEILGWDPLEAILHAPTGPVAGVAWGWLCSATLGIFGAWRDVFNTRATGDTPPD